MIEVYNPNQNLSSDYAYSTQSLADGFKVSQVTIRRHVQNHSDLQNKEYSISVQNMNGGSDKRMWTKKGAAKLADYIGTKKAKDFIETLIDRAIAPVQTDTLGLAKLFLQALEEQQNQINNIQKELTEVKAAKQNILSLVGEANQITPRNQLNKLISDYVKQQKISYSQAWHHLYREIFYRYKTNVVVRAERKKLMVLDYIEQYHWLHIAIAIMVELTETNKVYA